MGLLILLYRQKTRSSSAERGTGFLGREYVLSNYSNIFLFDLVSRLNQPLATMSQSYLTLGMGKVSLDHDQKLLYPREAGTSTNHKFLRSQLLQIYLPGAY